MGRRKRTGSRVSRIGICLADIYAELPRSLGCEALSRSPPTPTHMRILLIDSGSTFNAHEYHIKVVRSHESISVSKS